MNVTGRLWFKCRRGMKELDNLLLGYLERRYPEAPREQQQCFESLLELEDPQLAALILDQAAIDDPIASRVVAEIRKHRAD